MEQNKKYISERKDVPEGYKQVDSHDPVFKSKRVGGGYVDMQADRRHLKTRS